MFQPIRAIRHRVPDLEAATAWYAQLLDAPPVRTEPDEVRFDTGAFALQLARGDVERGNAVAFWGVDDLHAAAARLQALGAPVQPLDDGGPDRRACTCDPWGNVIGLIEVDDRAERAARSQRAAERVALRNVRARLDGLATDDQQRRRTLRRVGVLVTVLLALGGTMLAALVAESQDQQRGRSAAKLAAPPSR